MTHQEFIDAIAVYVKKYAPEYGIKVISPIIAQARDVVQYIKKIVVYDKSLKFIFRAGIEIEIQD